MQIRARSISPRLPLLAAAAVLLAGQAIAAVAAQPNPNWAQASSPLKTRWAPEVSPKNALPEYPRPQFVRKEWLNLNGLWDYSIAPTNAATPLQWQGKILVPFPVESALSGVKKSVGEANTLWYMRRFTLPKKWKGQRILLHFGAVDFQASVSVNGKEIGTHRGGYDPFSFEITSALHPPGTENEIVVAVWDPTDASFYSRGKQVRRPDQGIFYTSTTGIWQTPWIEPVPEKFIREIRLTPDLDRSSLHATVVADGSGDADVLVKVTLGNRSIAEVRGKPGTELLLPIRNPQVWSPESPRLYDVTVELKRGRKSLDEVESYFGMRKIALGKDENGVTRILLNNRPYFMVGPLDQGFWPDGLYTAPTDEALRYDIEITKKLGFNMARKHVKVEPDRWYYWADKLGLIVWQDMPSGDRSIGGGDPDIKRVPESAREFETELKAMIDTHYNHPSIVMWVVFNEGWGQYDTPRVTKLAKDQDPTRLVNNASGWADRAVGDVNDMHRYPGPGAPPIETLRAVVLGEFGGLGFKVDGHTWAGRTWGYRGMSSVERLTQQYVKLMRGVYELKNSAGLSAAVYTQTTDVEYEGNGLLTYDRAVIKMDLDTVAAANQGRFPPAPQVKVLVPTSQKEGLSWRYTTTRPANEWFKTEFDAGSWTEGMAGFGTRGTPGSVIRTEWKNADIWIRREITLPNEKVENPILMLHHDEDAEVYMNGVLAASVRGFTSDYDEIEINREAKAALHPGKNMIAIHCHQTTGGQYIDAGLVDIISPK